MLRNILRCPGQPPYNKELSVLEVSSAKAEKPFRALWITETVSVGPLAWGCGPVMEKQWTRGQAILQGAPMRWNSWGRGCLVSSLSHVDQRLSMHVAEAVAGPSLPHILDRGACAHAQKRHERTQKKAKAGADLKTAWTLSGPRPILGSFSRERKPYQRSEVPECPLQTVTGWTLSYADRGVTPRKLSLKIKTRKTKYKTEQRQQLQFVEETGSQARLNRTAVLGERLLSGMDLWYITKQASVHLDPWRSSGYDLALAICLERLD